MLQDDTDKEKLAKMRNKVREGEGQTERDRDRDGNRETETDRQRQRQTHPHTHIHNRSTLAPNKTRLEMFRNLFKTAFNCQGLMTCVEEVCSGRPLNIIRDFLTCARSVRLGMHMFKTALNYPSFVDLCTFCDVEKPYVQDSFDLSEFCRRVHVL